MHTEFQIHTGERRVFSMTEELHHQAGRSPIPTAAMEGPRHLLQYVNPAFCELVGRSREELEGVPLGSVLPGGHDGGSLPMLDRVFLTQEPEVFAIEVQSPGSDQPASWSVTAWSTSLGDDRPPGLVIQIADTTSANRFSETQRLVCEALMLFSIRRHELTASMEGATRQLRSAMSEIEHRAKNSLQTVASLLSFQLRGHPETIPTNELEKIQVHVKTLSAMHEMLMHATVNVPAAQLVPIRELLKKLLPLWRELSGAKEIRWSAPDIVVPIRRGLSLATVINELVCNSIKHGADTISVDVGADDRTVGLEVMDNGPGFPPNFDPRAATTLGLKLLDTLCSSELGGSIEYRNRPEGGACVEVSFPRTM